ncbi:MAG: Obg family GTPase CgtA, partial [Faecalibacterium sp.]|nr:Obg family GTPase CgtA [Faecalibacterium sp.]
MGEGSSFVIADIPGLIEGASEGVGLGHEFLRHVERCRMLLHIVDVAGSEGRDPIEDFEKINLELERFNPELAECPQIVAGNKIDLATDEQLKRFREYIEGRGYQYFEMCAPIVEGTKEVINAVAAKLSTLPPVRRYEKEEIPLEVIMKKQNTGFEITVEDNIYYVEAPWLIRVISQVNLEDYESLQYLQRVLISSGIIDALREKGIEEGDTVNIYDIEFDFVN